MNESTQSPGGVALASFLAAVLIGGGNFVAVRYSNQELAPFWGAGLRFSLAAMLFVAAALLLRLRWPRGRQLWLMGIYGLFSFTLSYALMYWALVRVTAGMAAVVLATVPLVTPLLAGAHRLEKLRTRTVLGALLALGGVVWMTVGPEGLLLELGGLIAVLVAALAIGESVILGKRVSRNHPVVTNAVAMPVGAVLLLAVSAVAGERWGLPTQSEVALSVAYLVLLGSFGLFILVLMVVRRWTASASSYVFVLFPVVTMLLEAWLIGEPLTVRGVTGALVVMAAVWFGALSPSARAASSLPTPTQASAPAGGR